MSEAPVGSTNSAREPPATVQRPRPTMRIGALARRTGRSVHTIRWYESQRLIPGVRRDAQGRRVYINEHVDWLELLERLRSSGMSIRGLREYTALAKRGAATIDERQALLRRHREHVERMITEHTASLALVDAKIAFYEAWRRTGERPAQAPRRQGASGDGYPARIRSRAGSSPG